MNRIYRIIWNRARGQWQVAGETAKSHAKGARARRDHGALGKANTPLCADPGRAGLLAHGLKRLAAALLVAALGTSVAGMAATAPPTGGQGGAGALGPGSPGSPSDATGGGAGGDGGAFDGTIPGLDGSGGKGGAHGYTGVGPIGGDLNGEDGFSGNPGFGGGGGGGGGGGYGAWLFDLSASSISIANNVVGGDGGDGGPGGGGGGGAGGDGGIGIFATDGTLENSGSITGGDGGDGGPGGAVVGGGAGGDGGIGIFATDVTLENSGSITGGDGGYADPRAVGPAGQGAASIVGADLSITNSGTIAGGFTGGHAGDENYRAAAIAFTGGTNTLELQAGSTLLGVIDIGADTSATITAGTDVSGLGTGIRLDEVTSALTFDIDESETFTAAGPLTGAGNLTKNGAGLLILSGANTFTGGTTVDAGTLQLGDGVAVATLVGSAGARGADESDVGPATAGGDGGTSISVDSGANLEVETAASIKGGGGGTGGKRALASFPNVAGAGGTGGLAVQIGANGTFNNNGTITGGTGGIGGTNANFTMFTSAAGQGGDGGSGVRLAVGTTFANGGTVHGGDGGAGGLDTGYGGGDGGNGGAGVLFDDGGSLTNSGSITGGAAGAGHEGGPNGDPGEMGPAVVFTGATDSSLSNAGSISGDVQMGDGDVDVSLAAGSTLSGTLDAGANGAIQNKSLALTADDTGAVTSDSFGGSTATGFNQFTVDAVDTTWTLTGAGTYTFDRGVEITNGTLKLADGVKLGGDIDLTLGADATLDMSTAAVQSFGTLDGAAGSLIKTGYHLLYITGDADSNFAGSIDDEGAGAALYKSGAGALTLTGSNQLGAGFTVSGGTLEVKGGSIASVGSDLGYASHIGRNTGGNGSPFASGNGALNISDGGAVQVSGLVVGDYVYDFNANGGFGGPVGSTGSVTVTGTKTADLGSSLQVTNDLYISYGASFDVADHGTLDVSDGGAVRVGGEAGFGNALVTVGNAGTLDVGSTLYLGSQYTDAGYGQLNITDGGQVTAGGLSLTPNDYEQAHVSIDGAGSRLDIGADGVTVGAFETFPSPGAPDPVIGITLANGGVLDVGDGKGLFDTSAPKTNPYVTITIGGADGPFDRMDPGSLEAGELHLTSHSKLVFDHADHSDDYTFAPILSGDGAVQALRGSTTLTGDSSEFTGTIAVEGGLFRTGVLTVGSTATVNAGQVTIGLRGMLAVDGALTTTSLLVDEGFLGVDGTLNSAGLIEVGNGSTLRGAGTINGAVQIDDGAELYVGGSNPFSDDTSGTLTIRSLTLSGGSTTYYTFGAPGTAAANGNDSHNNLLEVTGDLTLDGDLDIDDNGQLGLGVYKIIDYGGTLTNQGLTIDNGNADGMEVQTSVAGQVNVLVNVPDVNMIFWDGAGPANDGIVEGGAGSWDSGTGWTSVDGTTNSAFVDGSYAVFEGMGGKVDTSNVFGPTIAGMQFASDGYTLDDGGDAYLEFSNGYAPSTIKVGDGSVDSASYRAVIRAYDLYADNELVKTGAGTLELRGLDGYVELDKGLAVKGGVVQIGNAAGDSGNRVYVSGGYDAVTVSDGAGLVVTGLDGNRSTIYGGDGDYGDDAYAGMATGDGFAGAAAVVLQDGAALDNRGGRLSGGDGGDGGESSNADAGAGTVATRGGMGGAGGTGVRLATGAFANAGILIGGEGGDGEYGGDGDADSTDSSFLDGAQGGAGGAGGAGLAVTATRDLSNAGEIKGGVGGAGGYGGFGVISKPDNVGGAGGAGGDGGDGVMLARTARLTNHGEIRGGAGGMGGAGGLGSLTGPSAPALGLGGTGGNGGAGVAFAAGGTVINATDGRIVAGMRGDNGMAGGQGTGLPGPSGSDGYAVLFQGAADSALLNHGAVIGDVKLGDGDATVGITSDAVFACDDGNGNDVCRTAGTPTIDMGANGDTHDKTLELLAGTAASASYDGGYAKFGVNKLKLDSGTTAWTLDGDSSDLTFTRGIEIAHGTLVLGNALALSGQPALELTGADAVFDMRTSDDQSLATLDGVAGSRIELGDHRLSITGDDDSRFAGAITGDGALAKSGAGTLVLTADNTWSGGTTISDGTLQIGDGGTAGSIMGDVLDNGTLAFQRSDDVVFAGAISGDGALAKSGAGTLVLTADNTWSGGTTISDGTLQIGDGGTAGSIRGDVLDNGTLAFQRSDDVVFAGAISGDGALVQRGGGTLTLTSAHSYTGGTTISDGTLQIGDDGTTGSIMGDVLDDGVLAFQRSDDVVFAGAISGDGAVVQRGGGTLTLTGAHNYTGGTRVTAGALVGNTASLHGVVVDDATLIFDQADDGRFDGTLRGSGQFVKRGDGALTLNGANAFDGTTDVHTGTLIVGDDGHANAALGGTVTVDPGATLGGFGTIGALDLAGTLSPGHSIGTLHVAGDALFRDGSTLTVEILPDGRADSVSIGGKATLEGGTALLLGPIDGDWSPGSHYTVLTANGGVEGHFHALDSGDLAFLDPMLDYSANTVTLSLERNTTSFPSVATTRNQRAAAAGLESLAAGNALYDGIAGLDTEQARQAFGALSGEVHASTVSALYGVGASVHELSRDHLHANLGADAAVDGQALPLWTEVVGRWQRLDSDGNAANVDHSTHGLFVGGDHALANDWRLGGAVGYTDSRIGVDARDSRADVDSYSMALHAGKRVAVGSGSFNVLLGAAYSQHHIDTERRINAVVVDQHAGANYRAETTQAFAEFGYALPVGHAVTFEPFAGAAWRDLHTHGYHEVGGAATLRADAVGNAITSATLGAHLRTGFGLGKHRAHVQATLAWRHAEGDLAPTTTLAFDGGSRFTVAGAPLARNAAVVALHASLALSADASIGVGYSGQFGHGNRENAARIDLRWRF